VTRGRARTPPRDALPALEAEWVDERASTLTLGGFIQYLESAVLELLTAPRGLDVPVAEVVVYDPLDPMEPHPGDIICGVGIVPGTQRHAGVSAFVQASMLHLYDPDRSQNPMQNGKESSMEAWKVAVADIKRANAAGGAHVLSGGPARGVAERMVHRPNSSAGAHCALEPICLRTPAEARKAR